MKHVKTMKLDDLLLVWQIESEFPDEIFVLGSQRDSLRTTDNDLKDIQSQQVDAS